MRARDMNAKYKSIIFAACLCLALSASILAAPGDLDPTFGSGGIVITRGPTLNSLDYALGMAIQSDGKIVVVGEGNGSGWDFSVIRYNPDGSLDSSFGGGIVITPVGSSRDTATSVAIQADGKIVVAGDSFDGVEGASFAVVRYNSDGSLDTSFNGSGIVITSVGGPWAGVHSVMIQADGKIVAAGGSGDASTNNIAIVRYLSDGSLDTTYNHTGKI